RLSQGIDFEIFRPALTEKLHVEPKNKGGRRPYDYVLMFKIIILQRYYNVSDDQAEYQICDRLSFMRFLGLTLADDVPDSKTIWFFRERLTEAGLVEILFETFIKKLEALNLIINEGKIVDASFVEVPIQRNRREENKQIKQGEIPQQWQSNPNKLAQKDVDARWTKKNNVSIYGYKNHAKCDEKSKLITGYQVTDASVHDSQPTIGLLDAKDKEQPFYADSAYVGEDLDKQLREQKKVIPQIIEKGFKNKPLTEQQITSNNEKSKTRVRVEHIFGFVENSMNGSYIRSIGMARAKGIIGLMNLTYNLFRKIQIA
ncbi:MAG TPA: IS5 family transposase, partial [Candidatus Acidoferrales bacterium]|nr:IS5 family transposase [Candidatus Acidoferrales bacterium]